MWISAANPDAARDFHSQGAVDKFSVIHRANPQSFPQAVVNRFLLTFHSPCGELSGPRPPAQGPSSPLYRGVPAKQAGGCFYLTDLPYYR